MRPYRWLGIAALIVLLLAAASVALLGWFPVAILRGAIAQRLSQAAGAPVTIGGLTRSPGFSFTPDITANDVRVAQPGWVAGGGDFVRLRAATVRVPLVAALFGRLRPRKLVVHGAEVALYRDAYGRANWQRDPTAEHRSSGDPPSLTDLTVTDSTLSLRDEKRGLAIAGPLSVESVHGLQWAARGQFLATPATFALTGGRVVGVAPGAPYRFAARFASPALRLEAIAVSDGVLDLRHVSAQLHTAAPTLKNVDRLIEAGLFGTQPVNLTGSLRHDGRHWVIPRFDGTIGRSRFSGHATLDKQGEGAARRTHITAAVHASVLDFDDLADTQGRAAAARRRAAVGPRVIPPTRINLAKLGRTDGAIAFRIDHVLARQGSVFRTLHGDLTLDHRLLTVRNVVATLASGQITGVVRVDHRSGRPKLSLDLRLSGLTLEALVGKPALIAGRVRGRIALAGQGDTVREALSGAAGKAAIVATGGTVQRTIADVLGQNLSGAVSHAIGGPSRAVPLQCLIADFRGTRGILTPHTLAIDTGVSLGRGSGRIVLNGERIDLTIAGASKSHALLRIADPIRVGGTLGNPTVSVAGLGAAARPTAGGVLKVLGRSLGQALGLAKAPASSNGQPPATIDCASAVAAALR